MLVQHVSEPGWSPSAELGEEYGRNAAKHAEAVGLSKSVNVWLDLEGVNSEFEHNLEPIIDYCQAWYKAVDHAGYWPGLYVGYDNFLDASE